MVITTQYLIDIGFRDEFVPQDKLWDKNKLVFFNFLDQNDTIRIDLKYIEKLEEWKVDFIMFTGDNALNILYYELKGNSSLGSIIEFVKRNPMQTF